MFSVNVAGVSLNDPCLLLTRYSALQLHVYLCHSFIVFFLIARPRDNSLIFPRRFAMANYLVRTGIGPSTVKLEN